MPAGGAAADVKGSGGERETAAIGMLKTRGLAVSTEQLQRSSLLGIQRSLGWFAAKARGTSCDRAEDFAAVAIPLGFWAREEW